MTRSDYPLRLQSSLLEQVRRLAEKEATSVNQFINVAVAEKLSAMEVASYFRERAKRANIPEALALLDRLGTEPPRPGDDSSLTVQTGPNAPKFRPAKQGRGVVPRQRPSGNHGHDRRQSSTAYAAEQAGIAAVAEELDALRKERLRLHIDLDLTGLYNVVAKLRSGACTTNSTNLSSCLRLARRSWRRRSPRPVSQI